MPGPELSVVIVSRNCRDLLEACLSSILAQVKTPCEIVVVDNDSNDGTQEILAARFPKIAYIQNTTNRGFSAANNQGIAVTHAPMVAFINPDTVFHADPFPELLGILQHQSGVGCVAPELRNPDGTRQLSVRNFPTLGDQVITMLKLRHFLKQSRVMQRYMRTDLMTIGHDVDVDQPMGAALLIPRTVLETVGGWDEGYWIWFDEVALCRRIRDHQLRIVYHPNVWITHYGGTAFAQVVTVRKQWWYVRSLLRYAGEHWSFLARLVVWILAPVSLGLTLGSMIIKPR